MEGFDIGSTIDVALNLHPDTETIYYVVDNTTTGVAIMKEFSKVLPHYEDQLEVIRLDGENLDQITEKVSTLPQNSLILYLIYFKDNEGTHFEYNEAISMIEQKASIPVYGVWEFTLGHGIVGGKLTSGYYQGKTAAKIALRVLSGEKPSEIPVVIEETTHYGFDHKQMKKNNVNVESLPQSSLLINIAKTSKKQILILHSYNRGLQWTDDLERGISSRIKEDMDNVELIYEYMDVKRYADPVYLQNISELLARKHRNMAFDLIITTDDVAFNYLTRHHDTIYKDVPTIFCGVNYFEESMIENHPLFTGVVESYDLRGTIDTALKIQPGIENMIVINDTTVTGQANRKNLDLLMPDYQDKLSFEIWDDFNMLEIQEKVQTLESDSIILLLSFNLDKSNNSFTFNESIGMISEYASVPIYGLWDFYLGHGLTGGILTTGIIHGETAGAMAVDILNGKKPSEIAVVTDSPNMAMFDYTMLEKFGISLRNLPAESIVINRPTTIFDFFLENKTIVIPFIGILSILCLILLLMHAKIKSRKMAEEKLLEFTQVLETKNVELDVAAREAETANEAKSRYLAHMNHEMRTPLNGFLGFVQLMQDTRLDQQQQEFMEHMKQSATHLLGIINNVLDMASIEAGQIKMAHQVFLLEEEMETALAPLRYLALHNNTHLKVTMDHHLPRQVKGDPDRLRQIILNLGGNGVKFTHNGQVHMYLTCQETTEDHHILELVVEDTGPGMTEETLGKLFQPFYQGDDGSTSQAKGTGLGLTITKELVELMGGTIQVDSTLGKGTRAAVTLKLQKA